MQYQRKAWVLVWRMLWRRASKRAAAFAGVACTAGVLWVACKTTVMEKPPPDVQEEEGKKEKPPPPPLPPSPPKSLCEAHSALAKKLGTEHLLIGIMTEATPERYENAISDVPYGLKYIYLAEGAHAGGPLDACFQQADYSWWGCWNLKLGETKSGARLRRLFESTETAGQIPLVVYYTFYRTIGEGVLTNAMLANAGKVQDYFDDWRFALKTVNEYQQTSGKPVMIHIEPDLWGYAQQGQEGRASPEHLRVEVRSTTRGDCSDMADNFAGFGQCMLHMARKHAPQASIGLMASGWSTDVDINLTQPFLDMAGIVRSTSAYFENFRVGNDLGDFLVVEFTDRDAAYYDVRPAAEGGPEDRWQRRVESEHPNFPRTFAWAKAMAEALKLPLLWWQIPMGHQGLKNERTWVPDGQGGGEWASGEWKDDRVDYFFKEGGLEEVVKNHGIAVTFGPGRRDQTSPATDGGYLKEEVEKAKRPGLVCTQP